ncbi:MAG: serine/threonine-protein kinase [Ruminococcus sp.]|nr:serine/threonine-protein kinase [Ruminococcus sp.]
MIKTGVILLDKYEILKEIGRGGMSVVYLAMDIRLNKQWAVKEIRKKGNTIHDEITVHSLLAEAQLMKNLDHPALPRIVDMMDTEDTILIVMDYIEGETLEHHLLLEGPLPEACVIEWGKQLCDVLSYLHNQNPPIIYRDMKPSNIMLKPEGTIKIIDFGIAREYKEQQTDTMILGTKGYAPPEQYCGRTDQRSDIYALGMSMFHLLTGVDPRKGHPYIPVRQHNNQISEGIEYIIDTCVQPAAEKRYQNCKELLYDLEHPQQLTEGYRKKRKRKIGMFFCSAILCVVTLIAGSVCRFFACRINNNTYEAKISIVDATSLSEKIESYKQAIAIFPYDPRAYMKIVDAFEQEGSFGKKENDVLLALYNANKDGLDPTSAEVAELHYKIGKLYFSYYVDDDGTYSFAHRVQKAYPFFEMNVKNKVQKEGFSHEAVSHCYYHICTFYKKYILASVTVEEASKEDYELLFGEIRQTIQDMQTVNAYDQLVLYNGVLMFLYDQRLYMASVHTDKEVVMELLDMAYEKAALLSVQKEQSVHLRKQILEKYNIYRSAIWQSYESIEEKDV